MFHYAATRSTFAAMKIARKILRERSSWADRSVELHSQVADKRALRFKRCITETRPRVNGLRRASMDKSEDAVLCAVKILSWPRPSSIAYSMTCFYAEIALTIIWATGALTLSKITWPRTSASGPICRIELMRSAIGLTQVCSGIGI